MTERDSRIGELYEAALKKPIGERPSFVANRAGSDADLRQRVEALLAGQQDTALPGYESAAGSSTVLATGTQIGSYRIDGPLGAGGMGVVYRATDTKLHRPAAIKVLPENLADPEARRRFQREAQMVSSLNHPHIVTVYDAGEYLERQYLITEYVDGGTLRQWAARPRGWRPIVELLIGVADGIATAHDAGILHRDIKPENILLAKNGYAKLADFGLAKLFEADPFADDPLAAIRPGGHSSLIGTAAYMSPEQAQGLPLDGRSDVYSFGLVLYELLAGSRPFADRAPEGRHGGETPLPPLAAEVPAELRAIVAKALEHEPADRYQTMRDLVVDLRRLARHSGIDARGVDTAGVATRVGATTGPSPSPAQRRAARRMGYIVAALAALIVAAVLIRSYTRDDSAGGASVKVAVLPFRGETGGPDDLPISEGLGDTLRDELAPLPGLRVAARASSLALRDQNLDLRTLASRLGVSVLVSGSVRRNADDTLNVSVEVVEGETGTIDFSKSYQGTLLTVERELTRDVSAYLSPAGSASPAAAPTTEAAAARALVFARHFAREVRDSPVVDLPKLDKAIDYYRQAITADPQSEVAYSGLAAALLYRGDFDAAYAALKQALQFGKRSETFYTLALYSWRGGGLQTAPYIEGAFEKAIELNPNNADAVGDYALWRFGHRAAKSADVLFQRALDLDPQSLSRYAVYAEFLGSFDLKDRALELAELINTRFPNARGYRALARVYELIGDVDVGIGWALKALDAQPADVDTKLQIAELYARIGDFRTARIYEPEPVGLSQLLFERRYAELIDLAQEKNIDDPGDLDVLYWLAFAYNVKRNFAGAIRLLEEAGLPENALADNNGSGELQALLTWADAQLASGFGQKIKEPLEGLLALRIKAGGTDYTDGWWQNAYDACGLADLGRTEEALARLERTQSNLELIWLPFLEDAWCFTRVQDEPRYQAVVKNAEDRQAMLRERLPATLRERFPELKTSATP